MKTSTAAVSTLELTNAPVAEPSLDERLAATIAGVADDIVATTTTNRDDRLWPADTLVFQTNPLNLGYGACGTALFLQTALGGIPDEAEAWILRQRLSTATYAPGLYLGLAGIARAFSWLGHHDQADAALKLAYESPLLLEDVGVMFGAAGVGLASLAAHSETDDPIHLDQAVIAGEYLLRVGETDEDGRYWRSPADNEIHLGYAYGTSGIGCFLLRLSAATADERFRIAAIEAMEYTLRHAYVRDDKLQWFSHVGSRILYPYWRSGTAGAGIALIRFYQALRDDRYLDAARRAARGVRMLFSALPGQMDGMSGVGEFLIDLYNVTGERAYYRQARDLAESILCFRVETENGVAFPGRGLARLAADYAYGSAGTAAFFQRILVPSSRSLDGRLYCDT